MTSTDHAELVAARKRIAELEYELAIHRRAAGLLDDVVSQKAVRGDRGDRRRRLAGPAGHPGPRRLGVGVTTSGAAGRRRRGRCGTPGSPSRSRPFTWPPAAPTDPGACTPNSPLAWHHRPARRRRDADEPGRIKGLPGNRRPRPTHQTPTGGDLVHRQFTRPLPDQLWVTDITERPAREGKVYCAVVLDTSSAPLIARHAHTHRIRTAGHRGRARSMTTTQHPDSGKPRAYQSLRTRRDD